MSEEEYISEEKIEKCIEECDKAGLTDEAYSACIDVCYIHGEYDPVLVRERYARILAEMERMGYFDW